MPQATDLVLDSDALRPFAAEHPGESSLDTDSIADRKAFLEVRNRHSGVRFGRAPRGSRTLAWHRMGGRYGPHTWNSRRKGHAETQGHDDGSGSRTHGRRDPQGRDRPRGYSENGKVGGEIRKAELGHEGYSEMGKKGGEARKKQLGPEGYSELGHKGGQRVKQLIEQGKRAEGDGTGMSGREDKGKGKGRSKPRH